MRPVQEEELVVGQPLAWPLFDPAGKLLADAGAMVLCEAQRLTLLQRGFVDPALCLVEDDTLLVDDAGEPELPPPEPDVATAAQAIHDELAALAVDELTPRQALERIYQWRALLEDRDGA